MKNVHYLKYNLVIKRQQLSSPLLDLSSVRSCSLSVLSLCFQQAVVRSCHRVFLPYIVIVLSSLHKINHFRTQTGAQLGSLEGRFTSVALGYSPLPFSLSPQQINLSMQLCWKASQFGWHTAGVLLMTTIPQHKLWSSHTANNRGVRRNHLEKDWWKDKGQTEIACSEALCCVGRVQHVGQQTKLLKNIR